MPLLMPTLQAELISIFEKGPAGNPAPPLVALKTAKAYMTYVQPGINAGAGPTIAMPGSIALGSDLIQASVPMSLIIGSLCFSFILGTFFGVIPAYQASKLQPVEALRKK